MTGSRHDAQDQTTDNEAMEIEEKRLMAAVKAIQAAGVQRTASRTVYLYPVRAAARAFNVDHQKLMRRLNGVPDRCSGQIARMALRPSQEAILVRWIKELGHRSIPWTPELVREKASLIAGRELGEKWVYRFCARHPEIKRRWTVALESSRARALNRTNVAEFFELLHKTVEQYNIQPENIYNMDEKGMQMGVGMRARVLVDRNQKTVHMKSDGNRELVTVLECICADGSALSPLVIFKGKRVNAQWARNNLIKAT